MAKGTARDPAKEAFWRRMRGRQAGSKLSIRAWCREHGVNEATFHGWRREMARRDAEGTRSVRATAPKRSPSFVPVQVTDDGAKVPDPGMRASLRNAWIIWSSFPEG